MRLSAARAAAPAVGGIVLGLIAALSVLIPPPHELGANDPTAFSTARAVEVLRRVASEPHSIADPAAHDRARDVVVGQLRALGLRPQVRSEPVTDDLLRERAAPAAVRDRRLQNILVRIPGRTSRTTLLAAHYDSAYDTSAGPWATTATRCSPTPAAGCSTRTCRR